MDIALYGNLTIDTIIKNTEIYKSIGSIGNVWDALVKLDGTITQQTTQITKQAFRLAVARKQ